MLRRFLTALVAVPAGILLVTLAVTNRQPVQFSLDPFNADPLVAVQLPLYAFLLLALVIGVFLGGISVWLGQSQFRRAARVRTAEAKRWRTEADRLTRERDATVASRSKELTLARSRDAA